MFRPVTLAVAAAATLSALPAVAQVTDAKTYVMKAGAGDLYEKTSSKLELMSTNPAVKQFATQMIADHTKSTADVKAAAMEAGMKPKPPHMDAMQSANVAKLRRAHGAARDQMYIDQQKMAHQDALALQQGYAASGDTPPLKAVAGNIAPVVQSHIDMLNGMGTAPAAM